MRTIPPRSRTSTGDRLQIVDDDKRVEEQPLEEPREFRPLRVGDASDLELLPHVLRQLAGEVRDLSAAVHGNVVPALRRIEERQVESDRYLVQVAKTIHNRIDRLTDRIVDALVRAAEAK